MRWCSTWQSKYGVAAHRFYLIGIGKDKEVAPNTTADGRKQNRRVEVQLLSNMSNGQGTTTSQTAPPPQQQLEIENCVYRLGRLQAKD